MSESEHTPGPWSVQQRNAWLHIEGYRHPEGEPSVIAALTRKDEANARLIAAAPDMLEALKIAVAELEQAPCRDNAEHSKCLRCAAIASGNNAIAKAKGGQQ